MSIPARSTSGSSNAVEASGATVEAILITHCHIDHIGAVSPVAAATGAPVYCPELEADAAVGNQHDRPGAGHGPVRELRAGRAAQRRRDPRARRADPRRDRDARPRPGHVTYSVRDEDAIFSGDVLFQSSVGRVDLPGGDGPTLLRSIQTLLDTHPAETDVYPGHMGPTTLGAERATNPFLTELAR